MSKQPIDTAPKDRPILLCIDGDWYQGEYNNRSFLMGGRWAIVDPPRLERLYADHSNLQPTHWAEIPA